MPTISHAIVAVEVFEHTPLADDLPLESRGTPISYLSVSDFLNLSQQLRTVPEFVRYLDERRSLPEVELRAVGAEQVIFSYYLLFDGFLASFNSRDNAERILAAHTDELYNVLAAKTERDRFGQLLEHVADQLSGRHPNYRGSLSAAVLSKYEPLEERRAYLTMQDILAGMQLAERAELGTVFHNVIQLRKAEGGRGFTFVATLLDSQPDWVLVFGSFGESSTFSRDALLSSFHPLTTDAMVHYARSRCLIIVDRDGVSYEVGLAQLTSSPSPEQLERRSKVFEGLKISSKELHFRPTVL